MLLQHHLTLVDRDVVYVRCFNAFSLRCVCVLLQTKTGPNSLVFVDGVRLLQQHRQFSVRLIQTLRCFRMLLQHHLTLADRDVVYVRCFNAYNLVC